MTGFEFDMTVTLSFLLALATVVFTWWRTRDRNLDTRFDAVDQRFREGSDRMGRHDTRLNAIEQALRELPTRDNLHQLQLAMERVAGQLAATNATIEGMAQRTERLESTVERVETYLLQGGGK